MNENRFTWCDLSTFELRNAILFYESVFGWKPQPMGGAGVSEDYTLLYAGKRASAAAFTMPAFLQEIDMPSFWMSYVYVADLNHTLASAESLGAKVEIKPTDIDERTRFALIRDPAGAGFTIYEGDDWKGRDKEGRTGRLCWNELHLPSLELVEDFYRSLFGWNFVADPDNNGRYAIQSARGRDLASVLVLDESAKGPKNYWAVYFSVENLSGAMERVINSGGSILSSSATAENATALAVDNQGAAFFLIEHRG